MSRLFIAGLLFAAGLFPWQAMAAMHWAPAPIKHSHGGHDRSAGKPYQLIDGKGATASIITPHLDKSELEVVHQKVVVKPTGMDNYHAIVATRMQGELFESATRYVYMFGKPSGASPSNIMAYEKSPLEIEPAPYAREHWRYYSDTEAVFIVRFKGKPLSFVDVNVTTSNGSTLKLKSDADGKITVLLPEDFETVSKGRRGNKPAEFILEAQFQASDKKYLTSLSADYHVNPRHWQSTTLGLITIAVGMFLGLIIIRKRKGKV